MSKGPYGRKDRLIKEHRHDPYQERCKCPEPTCCTRCGAVFVNGRWSWQSGSDHLHTTICPACRRIADNFPAGQVEIEGPFFKEHHDEILNLISNEEMREKSDRPLERIIAIRNGENRALVTTTGVHIARRIGQALSRAYSGELSFTYADEERSIRVLWQR
jgi:hypothetical protein